ncbi:MAG: hypothetical protein ABMA02_14630 [Saprospiraceae bacterium]
MSSFFRKAISLFVIPDDEATQKTTSEGTPVASVSEPTSAQINRPGDAQTTLSGTDIAKFEQHFAQLFEKANLPGPDYFEFWKTMDTLESHIPDETARMKAVYASLKIQGLNKKTLISTAGQYREAVLADKASFEAAVQKKSEAEIAGRQAETKKIEKEREDKQRMIETLRQEIEAAAVRLAKLQEEIGDEQRKIEVAQRGYLAACNAMVSKIEADIEQFQQIIE